MARFFLISVGTSLMANFNKSCDEGCRMLPEWLCGEAAPETFPGHDRALADSGCFHHYCECWRNWEAYAKDFAARDALAKLSAEMSTLLFWKDDQGSRLTFQNGDHLLLVATNTPDGQFCAHALKHLLDDRLPSVGLGKPGKIEIVCDIDGLGKADDGAFATRGLPNFISFIQDRVRQNKGAHKVVLIPTGGYKALIPYMVIAGILERVPNWYVYEDSANVLGLPPLPLHVDVPAWLQMESVLDVLEGKTDYRDKKLFNAFQDKISGLIAPAAETSELALTGLDAVFRHHVRQVAPKPELVIRAEQSPLLAFLDDKDLEERFLMLAAIGHLIWKGDRVPEMADHSLRHHNDLFHLAERVLLPIFYYNEKLMEPHELYTLLCALFLHDCGHVVGSIDLPANIRSNPGIQTGLLPEAPAGRVRRRLLPTEVRDHHHVLGYLRLGEWDNHGGTGRSIHDALRIGEESNEEIWKGLLSAPATIGLYHRKKMRLMGKNPYDFFGMDAGYLQSLAHHLDLLPGRALSVKGRPISFDKAALLVCLLRVIDGLDEQASRTGSPDDVAFHLAQLETEAKEHEEHARAMGEALRSLPGMEEIFADIDGALCRRIFHYIGEEGKGFEDEEIRRRAGDEKLTPEAFQARIEEALEDRPEWHPLFQQYIHSSLLAFFKRFQKEPYGEKVYIREISIGGTFNHATREVIVTIDLDVLKEADSGLIRKYIEAGCPGKMKRGGKEMDMETPEGRESYRQYMLESLEKEYTAEDCGVAEILRRNGIRLVYARK